MISLASFAKHLNFHPLFEEGEGLREVADAELVLGVQVGVLDFEIEPLLVPLRVRVNFAEEIVLLDHRLLLATHNIDICLCYRLHFGSFEIPTFQGRVKFEVVWSLRPPIAFIL